MIQERTMSGQAAASSCSIIRRGPTFEDLLRTQDSASSLQYRSLNRAHPGSQGTLSGHTQSTSDGRCQLALRLVVSDLCLLRCYHDESMSNWSLARTGRTTLCMLGFKSKTAPVASHQPNHHIPVLAWFVAPAFM